jgi:hypothetical protein
MIVAGCDPGVGGAIVVIDDERLEVLSVLDLPVVRAGTLAWLDGGILHGWLKVRPVAIVVLEQVAWKRGDESKANIAALIRVAGGIEAVVSLCRLPLHHVMPGVWKKRAGLAGRDKPAAIALARSRLVWPEGTMVLAKHHNRADAALIALYGRAPAAAPKPPRQAKPVKPPAPAPLFE